MSKFEFAQLEGWVTTAQAADDLGISRQAVHKMLGTYFNRDDVCQVGSSIKPFYLIRLGAIHGLKSSKKDVSIEHT